MDSSNRPDNDNQPARRPDIEVLDSAPDTSVADAQSKERLVRIGLAVVIFIIACAAMVYFWNN
ncbi:MAG: hypothetical protein EOP20_02985 [Hyphomicrobiales bacterium]|nr:MAG: hypothetical protein EOP20_02985 [Hyphomicrobiales bacterium]